MESAIKILRKNIIETLERENELRKEDKKQGEIDIPFTLSTIDQHIGDSSYDEFLKELYIYDHQVTFENYDNGWLGYGKLVVDFFTSLDEYIDHRYVIELSTEQRHWGYCQCTKEDKGYRSDKDCCGCGCDWDAPSFRLIKETFIGGEQSWDGNECDYWDYEDSFYKTNEELAIEKVRKEKEDRIKYLQESIQDMQYKLDKLISA